MFLDLSGVHATRWCSVVYPKNVLGPIAASTSVLDALNRPEQCSFTHLAVALHPHQTVSNPKNVPGPIRGSLRSLATDDAYPNNVRRPIGNSLQALIESCQPEKCSWTYPGIAPLAGHRRCIPE